MISEEGLTQMTFYKESIFRTQTFLEQNIFDLDFYVICNIYH